MLQKIERFYYKHYLINHLNKTNRLLHFIANLIIFISLAGYFLFGNGLLMLGMGAAGYSLAFIGHVFFERNLPVIVGHPFLAIFGDLWMFFRMLRGRIGFDLSVYKDFL